ncbi:MAG: 6-pyruvoyl-tetrahydropterin synthase-related protein [Candidatus Bathyarchaeota archaeon]
MSHLRFQYLSSLKERTVDSLKKNRYLLLLFILCFTVSLIFSLNEFPTGSDIPAHYIKILNMHDLLKEGQFVRWSYDWYAGYAMFDIYPPLLYVLTAVLSFVVENVSLAMKLITVASFSVSPVLIYRLGRVLGRTPKGASVMAFLFTLNPLNLFFLFNGYFVFTFSLLLIFIFLTEFFKYTQKRDKTSFLITTATLAIISLTYHRALYFILLTVLFYFLLKVYRRQVKEATSAAIMTITGVGMSAFWLLPAIKDMFSLQSYELYQSLVLEATSRGVSFQTILMLSIVPYIYLVFKRIRKRKIEGDSELVMLLSLIFFTILALGPYGPLYYILPFSSSQRVEVTLLIAAFYASALAADLFDERIKDGRRTFGGILLSGVVFLAVVIGIFFYPGTASGLEAVNFTYSRGGLNDSVTNLVNNAYVKEQVFLGKSDEGFLKVLRYISNDSRDGRVVFYSNRSQTVDMFYYYALLPLSGKSTPQGIAPEGEGDLKWGLFTQHIIWDINETLLKLAGTRWIISTYPLALDSAHHVREFDQYRLYELEDIKMITGSEGSVNYGNGEIQITLSQECRSFTFAESYNQRWHAFDQYGKEIKVESTEYGFIRITSANNLREVHLIYSDTTIDLLSRIISVLCLALFVMLILVTIYGSSQRLARLRV